MALGVAADVALVEQRLRWMEPKLVAQIGDTEFTSDGSLRHPRFLGLREDRRAVDRPPWCYCGRKIIQRLSEKLNTMAAPEPTATASDGADRAAGHSASTAA